MSFSPSLTENIRLLNNVLDTINVPPLFENLILVPDRSGYGSHDAVRFASENLGLNTLPIDLYLFSDSIRIDIFDIPESFEWNNHQIHNDPNSLKAVFLNLLTCYSLLEYKKSPHSNSRIYFFDRHGEMGSKFVIRGLGNWQSTWGFEKHLFFPIATIE
jgi:hypothetical protein